MLEELESTLLPALTAAAAGSPTRAGPGAGPTAAEPALLRLVAERWEAAEPGQGPNRRESARQSALLTATPGADPAVFNLPGAQALELLEVEAPPGRVCRAGDEYSAEVGPLGWTLVFLTPPVGPVQALVSGAPARGFTERRPVQARLRLVAWAADAPTADALLGRGLGALLPALVGLEGLEASWGGFPTVLPPGPGARGRLLGAQAWLDGVSRGMEAVGDRALVRAEATFTLRAELDLAVVLPAQAARVGPIQRLEGTLRRDARPAHPQRAQDPEPLRYPPAPPPPPPGPPPLAAQTVDVFRTVSDSTEAKLPEALRTLGGLAAAPEEALSAAPGLTATERSNLRRARTDAQALLAPLDGALLAPLAQQPLSGISATSAEELALACAAAGAPGGDALLAAVTALRARAELARTRLDTGRYNTLTAAALLPT